MEVQSSSTGVSVIICCYNSSQRLQDTLRHLATQEKSTLYNYELIIVDNNSKDNTASIALQLWNNLGAPFPINIINESNQGLSYARKAGINASLMNNILFCDDDNHLEKNYLKNGLEILNSKAEIGIVGGISLPKLEVYPGKWIEDMYGALAISAPHVSEGFDDWVFGAGMFIKKKVFQEFAENGLELHLTDRVGKRQTSGGDTEICFLARHLGYKIWRSKDLKFHHFINKNRLQKSFFIKGNYKNIYPSIYLFILGKFIDETEANIKNSLYREYLLNKLKGIFYFLPRMVLGNHKFYSFLMFYQNIQITAGLLFRRKQFKNYYFKVKQMINGK